jgi:hypothetical protein
MNPSHPTPFTHEDGGMTTKITVSTNKGMLYHDTEDSNLNNHCTEKLKIYDKSKTEKNWPMLH